MFGMFAKIKYIKQIKYFIEWSGDQLTYIQFFSNWFVLNYLN